MTIRSVLSEVWRNVSSGTTKAVLWAVLTGAMLTLLSLVDAAAIRDVERQALAFQAAAADVRKLPAAGQIDGAACDGLARVPTVGAAGAVREVDPIQVQQAPGTPLTAYQVTVGLGSVIGLDGADPLGVWIEAGLAQSLLVAPGDVLTTAEGDLPVAAVFTWPDDGRDIRFGFAVLVPRVPDVAFDECWIRAWPVVDDNDQLLRSTVVVSSSMAAVQIGQLNKNLGVELDAHRLFQKRVTRHVQWAAPLAMLMIGFVASWRRRLEYASALHAGQLRGDALLGTGLETLVWAATGALVALAGDLVGIRVLGIAQVKAVWLLGARMVAWSVAAALSGTLLGAWLIRERDLFHYFRTR
ncbi:MAG: hypothetical protein LBJ44_10385 [Propionibacteriaceae bacterium]|nr:hypothetical protein [Propionibacteriaceae bacterium]